MAELDWGNVRSGGGGENTSFMRLEAGMNVARIVGKPYQVDIHWEKGLDGQNKKVVCPGAGCPLCKIGRVPMGRFQVQVINHKTNKVEILEGGPRIFGQIRDYAMDPDYGDPTMYDIKIKKEGSGRETKYTVIAAPNKRPLNSDQLQLVENAKTLGDINKPKSIEEINAMGLEALAGSISDLDDFGSTPTSKASGDTDLGISDK